MALLHNRKGRLWEACHTLDWPETLDRGLELTTETKVVRGSRCALGLVMGCDDWNEESEAGGILRLPAVATGQNGRRAGISCARNVATK